MKVVEPTILDQRIRDKLVARDNVEYILALLADRGYEVTICADDIEYESVDELAQHRGDLPPTTFLRGTRSEAAFSLEYIGIRLGFSASVYARGTGGAISVARHIADYLSGLPPRVSPVLRYAGYAWGLPAYPLAKALLEGDPITSQVVVWALLAIGSIASFTYTIRSPGFTLRARHENFWRRNSDKILILLIGLAIGAAITALTNWLTT